MFREDRRVPIFRDSKLQRIDAFNQYALYSARNLLDKNSPTGSQAYDSGIEQVAYALQALSRYLAASGIEWTEFDDNHFAVFRDWVLSEIEKDPRCRNDLSAKRTANYRMRVLYDFYWWAQEECRLCEKVIGSGRGFRIRSVIVEAKRDGTLKTFSSKRLYPKCFSQVGEGSRTSQNQYWATEDDVEALIVWFRQNRTPAVAERNVLMLRLAHCTGWRRNALQSLTVDDFSDKEIAKAAARGETKILIRPSVQKFGNAFKKPISLLWCRMVNDYITGGREHLLDDAKVPKRKRCEFLFVRVDNGEPLTLQHISEEFGEAFRAIGCERRSESDTGWRRRSEMRNDSCSAELFGACCRRHRWAVSGASKGARRASADAPGAARFRKG
ncbi:hypothetical protein [Caballeronia sp. SBC1]|uniref:hypothetical protein n=1 Tax=Caballeronia sp. SBC1 TaxID=2705548 RepID=UPI001408777D|nr:hypothetical protein [Caballeronia sp. SBC1]